MSKKVSISESDVVFEIQDDDTVLEGAEKAGYSIPYSCRKGVCSTCTGKLVTGEVNLRSQHTAGPAEGVMFCQARPVTDVTIEPTSWTEYDPSSRKIIESKIKKITWLNDDVAEVVLRFPIGVRAIFSAGQYLNVLFDGTSRSYSMANPPHKNTEVVLHVRRYEGGEFSDGFLRNASENDTVAVEIPFGDVQLRLDESKPLILLATGTGFAPVKSIVEALIRQKISRPVHFFWGAKQESDLYAVELVNTWQRKYEWLSFTPVLSRPSTDWSGSTGWVQSVVKERFTDLSACSVYACGNDQMVSDARNLLTSAGLSALDFHCDSFVPASAETSADLQEISTL